jgi:hypothetical protein
MSFLISDKSRARPGAGFWPGPGPGMAFLAGAGAGGGILAGAGDFDHKFRQYLGGSQLRPNFGPQHQPI